MTRLMCRCVFQDTIVALQALEEIAEKIYADEVDMHIQIIAKSAGTEVADERFTLKNANHDVLQLKHVRIYVSFELAH